MYLPILPSYGDLVVECNYRERNVADQFRDSGGGRKTDGYHVR